MISHGAWRKSSHAVLIYFKFISKTRTIFVFSKDPTGQSPKTLHYDQILHSMKTTGQLDTVVGLCWSLFWKPFCDLNQQQGCQHRLPQYKVLIHLFCLYNVNVVTLGAESMFITFHSPSSFTALAQRNITSQ